MDKGDLSARLLATFAMELEDQVRALNEGFLALEQKPEDAETVKSLFRSAHTVKGAARVAGVKDVEQICHALETRIAEMRDQGGTLASEDFRYFFGVVDELKTALARLQAAPVTPAPEASDQALASEITALPTPSATGPDVVRIPAGKLDRLLGDVNELIMVSARLEPRLARPDARALTRVTNEITAAVHDLRLRRFGDATEGLPRAVRDIGEAEHKQVRIQIAGADVEADRAVIDALREPLLHLVRNAVSHGIEAPAARRAAGKPEAATVRVGAALRAGKLVVTVADDGRGMNTAAIRRQLAERGQPVPTTDYELARALFRGGVSTAARTTKVSGRGVGLDLVREGMERIGGNVAAYWNNTGTTFVLECPPSLALIRAVFARVDTQTFAIPITQIERLIRVRPEELRTIEGRALLQTKSGPLPIASLAAVLGPPLRAFPVEGAMPAVIITAGGARAAVLVDDLVGEDEIVLRPLQRDRFTSRHLVGGALLASGRVALVLNVSALIDDVLQGRAAQVVELSGGKVRARERILIADDSITTRTLEQSVLEGAGYEVVTAVDGQDAWERLQAGTFDALVSDVEMPRLTGLDLCARIRASKHLGKLPVILVTGREAAEDRSRGLEIGADAYIVKSSFDQTELLKTLRGLVG